jgi:hypothetical protein
MGCSSMILIATLERAVRNYLLYFLWKRKERRKSAPGAGNNERKQKATHYHHCKENPS